MNKVFVLDSNKHPLDPIHPGRARLLLTQGKAAVFRRYPFIIITKYNRVQRGYQKTHWLDAACVGASIPQSLHLTGVVPLFITAHGHGRRQLCLMDTHGFPRTKPKQTKRVKGFQTGDLVRAVIPNGVKRGTYIGRVAVRATGSFNITTKEGKTVQGISYRHCTPLQTCDGYSYQKGEATFPPAP